MFYKLSTKVGIEYISAEIAKVAEYAAIISEPYSLKHYQLIDTCYNYLSPYQSQVNEAARVKQVATNLFGKPQFSIYNITGDKVKWIPVFEKAIKVFMEQQYDEDMTTYFILVKKLQQLNQALAKSNVKNSEGASTMRDIMDAISEANKLKKEVEERIFVSVREKKVRIGSDRELSWMEQNFLAKDMSTDNDLEDEEYAENEDSNDQERDAKPDLSARNS